MSTFRIDDRDEKVEFIGQWSPQTLIPASNGTITQSSHAGDRAIAQFVGTSVEVWGLTLDFRGPNVEPTTMILDISIDAQFVESASLQVSFESRVESRRLWVSPQLLPGVHSIEVTIHELELAATIIDYFQVFTPEGNLDPSSSSRTSTSSSTIPSPSDLNASPRVVVSTGMISAGAGRNASPEGPSTVALSNGNKTTVGPIVGGVIGGVLVILFGVLAGIWIVKGRRKTSRRAELPHITPFEKDVHHPITSPFNSLATPVQPKARPCAPTSPSQIASPISKPPLFSSHLPPTRHYNSTSVRSNPSSSSAGPRTIEQAPEDDPQVAEAMRTLQTYLQQQPQGCPQVAQRLGMSMVDTSAPPAYDERR